MQALPAQAGSQAFLMAPGLLAAFSEHIDAKPATLKTYIKGIKAFLAYCAANSIATPERADLLRWRASLGAVRKATTVSTYLAGIRRFFAWAALRGLCENIAADVKGLKVGREFKKDCLSRSQARDLLESIDQARIHGLRDYALVCLMLSTGLRGIEVSRADIGDMRMLGDSPVLYVQGKGRDGKAECVKLAEPVEKALRGWLSARTGAGGAAPLFCGLSRRTFGQRLATRSISRIIKRRLVAIGLDSDRLTAHSLRHTAATIALKAGEPLQDVSQMMRHANLSTTMIYNHAIERERNSCEDSIAAALFD